jgi:hypothetical protein
MRLEILTAMTGHRSRRDLKPSMADEDQQQFNRPTSSDDYEDYCRLECNAFYREGGGRSYLRKPMNCYSALQCRIQ